MKYAKAISTPLAPAPSGIYSQAVVAPPFIFLSGQGPFEPATRELVQGDTEAQLRAVMKNLEAVADAAGSSLRDAVRFGVYLSNLAEVGIVNKVFEEVFDPPYPARTTIQSTLTRFNVEVDCVLYMTETRGN